ncbi:hypothetical protein ACTU3I_01055 [Microbacterium sp. RD1]|uniref:hypothetical protein n=1 Tax=Microbacterium sp. RD1 TaxID=3457313 RepID=UPI003FA528DD
MTTTLNPPPVPPAGSPVRRPNRTAGRVITILTAVLGGAILLAIILGGVRASLGAALARSETRTAAVGGVSNLDIDVSAAALVVRFDEVREATLDVRDSRGGSWTLERDGDTLRVETPRTPFFSWFGSGNGQATLVLPAELEGSDARFGLGAGSLSAEGAFGALQLDMSAGRMNVTGSAAQVTAEASAGRAELDLDDVDSADLQLSAGEMNVRLGGSAPTLVDVSVSAGSLQLDVPDAVYDVRSDVSAGSLDNRVRTDSAASAQIVVEVSAGGVTLRPIR